MEYSQKIQAIINALDDVKIIAEGAAAQNLLAEMELRIFNEGKDVTDLQIGSYSEGYAELRKAAGLQVAYVDLTFTTDLKQSIVQQENRIIYKNDYGRTIAKKNERHFGKKIFSPSKKERENAIDIMKEEVNKLFL